MKLKPIELTHVLKMKFKCQGIQPYTRATIDFCNLVLPLHARKIFYAVLGFGHISESVECPVWGNVSKAVICQLMS